ncbi:MAG TPA: hypothetical protein VMZ92_07335, partial [Planctomycetota bacterium]|nr:hypothetical protein [Planctomycetota bacterium]
VERAKGNIVDASFDVQFAAHNHQATAADEVYAPDGLLYGTYTVRVVENHGDVDGQYLVISQGTTGQTIRQVDVVLRRKPLEIPDLLAAIMLYNPSALELFRGVPPNVCGLDTNLPDDMPFSDVRASDCTPGSGDGPDAVGIGVHDDQSVTEIVAALGSRTSRVIGTDGSGNAESASVYNVTGENPTGETDPLTAPDIIALAEDYAQCADYIYDSRNWYNGDGQLIGTGNLGTTTTPEVVVVRGEPGEKLILSGNLTGAGLLVIDCEVEFKGTFNYAGLIVITSRGEATVSLEMMGTPLVMGGILAANPADNGASALDLRGTADVFFSRQGLAYAQQALTKNVKFETLFYTERKPSTTDLEVQ